MPVTVPAWPDAAEAAERAAIAHLLSSAQGCVEIEEYHIEGGYCIRDRIRTRGEVITELESLMGQFFDEYGFSRRDPENELLCPAPEQTAYIACYAVTGGSEGHYVHVGFVLVSTSATEPVRYVDLCFGKTFRGREYACLLAHLACRLMGA